MKKSLIAFIMIVCAILFMSCDSNPNNTTDNEVTTVTKVNDKEYTVYTFTPATTYQTVDGIGAGFTYYTGWVNYQSSDTIRNAEFDALFSDAKIPILRFMCKYEYTTDNADAELATMKKFYTVAAS